MCSMMRRGRVVGSRRVWSVSGNWTVPTECWPVGGGRVSAVVRWVRRRRVRRVRNVILVVRDGWWWW